MFLFLRVSNGVVSEVGVLHHVGLEVAMIRRDPYGVQELTAPQLWDLLHDLVDELVFRCFFLLYAAWRS